MILFTMYLQLVEYATRECGDSFIVLGLSKFVHLIFTIMSSLFFILSIDKT